MLKSHALGKRLINVRRNHVANPMILSLNQHVYRITGTACPKKILDCLQVLVMHRLVKKLDELSQRLVDIHQVAQWNADLPVGRDSVQTILDSLLRFAVF